MTRLAPRHTVASTEQVGGQKMAVCEMSVANPVVGHQKLVTDKKTSMQVRPVSHLAACCPRCGCSSVDI
jgi:hypothetical protein